ncbi:rho GTPase-activating protein 20 isoform X2 [Falco biarmicus]|uniref:rho GTPase-activating protein 20 isoform X2 n=1 Tax=Falco rusticolus TaxID=120794 RepID=UPI0018869A12|nr:rho GTPase-activating protein 20 isoform X2 [Falco rusticolus]XP_055558945.1 rho GTPase-activating protein 20 isoform X2 [Falco cherrug]XP_055658764.1 rho GTPase-activating protein 20 isoform X2 [Falco peregrinus]XP_056185332.1 rho GTPase-activating protein 20 isoform X2 [Falco biarmicus]
MDVMSPQQEHLGPGRSSSVSGESRVFAAADSKKKMKSLAQRRQSAPSLIFVKALNRSRSISREGCFSPISPEACPLVQSFMCHNRTFILDGHVQLKTGLQTQERHLFLFTDLLVVAKSKSHSHFKLKCQARLCEMWTAFCTEEVCEGSTDPERSFVLGWPTTNCVANFRSAEQKETWLSFLQSQIREEKEKDYPKSIPLKIIAKDVGTCAYSKTLSVTNVDTANDVILMALQQLGINGSEKDYKLWVISGREDAPYPLIDLSQKSFKRKRSIINWAFWRGPGTHLDNAPLSSTSAAPGKLFGLLLTAICEDDNLPKPLLDMLSLLYQEGPSTEGIFRRSGSAKTCKELKEKLDSGAEVDLACESIFVTASLFKDFLRNIPGSILSSQLCDKWVSVMDQGNNEEKIKSIQRLIEQLPRANVVLLRYIFGVLHGIERRSEENQMNAFNLAICIAPSLLWPPVSSTPDIESEFTKKISSLVQFLTENCCRIFGEEITSLFGEILMTCKRENSSDAVSLHLNDSSYDSLENEANDEADSSSSDWIKNRDQDNRSRESVFTLSDGDSEQTEVDEIQSKTKSKQLTISVDVHRKFSSQENSENESLCSSALGCSSAATSDALKTLRRHRRSSEPAIGLLASNFARIGDGHEKATRKASCDVVLFHEDEDYLRQLRSLQMEGQKLINQSLIIGINVGKSDNTNQNVEKKDLSHCLLPPMPEGLNICSGFSSSSLSSPGTSPSVSSMSSLDSAFSQFSDQSVFTPTETSSPFDSTFQPLKKPEDTAAEADDDYLVTPTKVPPCPQPTDALAERGSMELNSRPAPLKPTDGVDGYLIKPDIQPLPLRITGRDRLHDPRSKRRSRRALQQSKV